MNKANRGTRGNGRIDTVGIATNIIENRISLNQSLSINHSLLSIVTLRNELTEDGQRRRQRQEKESRRGGGVVLGRRIGWMRIGLKRRFPWVWCG
jgi:hypothetical protein